MAEDAPSGEINSKVAKADLPTKKKELAKRVFGSILTLGGLVAARESSGKYIPPPQPREVRDTSQVTTIPKKPPLEFAKEPINTIPSPLPASTPTPVPESPSIPTSEGLGESKEETEQAKIHKVGEGETLDSIAEKYGVPLVRLRGVNGLVPDSNSVVIGQELIIPRWGIVEQTNEKEHIEEVSKQFPVWVKFTLPQAMAPKEIAGFFGLASAQELIETNRINVGIEEEIPEGVLLIFSAGKGIIFGEEKNSWNLRWTPRRNGLDVSQLIWLDPNTGRAGYPKWPNEAFFVIPEPTQYWTEAEWSSSNLDFKEHPERYQIIFVTDEEDDTVLENSQGEKTVLKGKKIIGLMLRDGPPALEYFQAGQWIDEEGKVFKQGQGFNAA